MKGLKDWNIEAMTGYKPISTFYMDLSIADQFGADAVKDTYRRVVKSWLSDYKMFTEFVMALNWKIWEHYETNEPLAELYNELWVKAGVLVEDNFTDEEKRYYYRVTD